MKSCKTKCIGPLCLIIYIHIQSCNKFHMHISPVLSCCITFTLISSIVVLVLKKQDQLRQKVIKIEATMDNSIDKIKKTTMSKQEIEKMHNDIVSSCEGLMGEIKQRQEQERREEEEVRSIESFYLFSITITG